MATANLFNREVKANKSPRNAFNMQYSTLFTSPVGMLLPTYIEHVEREDKLNISITSLTRTRPLNTSAYMSFDEKTDFWFIPYKLLWSDYDEWRIGQTYRHRTTNLDSVGKQNYQPFCRYQDIAYWFENYRRPGGQPIVGVDDWLKATPSSALRYLDLLMYSVPQRSDRTPYISQISYANANGLSTQDNSTNPIQQISEYYKSIDDLTPVNYMALLAFQCVYMHAYRNEEYEELDPSYYNIDNLFDNLVFNNTTNFVYGNGDSNPYHLASYKDMLDTSSLDNRVTLDKLFTPRYKNWRKDLFTAIKPTNGFNLGKTGLQIGTDLSANTNTYGSGFYWPSKDESRPFPTEDVYTDELSGRYNPLDNLNENSYTDSRADWTYQMVNNPANVFQMLTKFGSGDDIQVALYPQNLRNLMAMDKFSRASIYADKDLSSQIKALFGIEQKDYHKPEYLGSYVTQVNIDDVTATAAGQVTTDDAPTDATQSILGQIAGKAKTADGKNSVISRKFDEEGIVMGIHYIMPRNNYDSYRISKWNTKVSRFDYFWPQFDGLGLQPVLAYERKITDNYASSLFGFAPRYYEYKTRQNEVHGGFMSEQPDNNWTLTNNPIDVIYGDSPYNYKIYPQITNRIFGLEFDGSMMSDPFQHYYNFDVTKVSNMEVYGTPSI